jgi:hypothetical protein
MSQSTSPAVPIPKAIHAERDLAALRALSLEERGRLIKAACRTTAAILTSRRAMGLPDPAPAPWPDSTWEFLRKHAAHHDRRE